MNSVITYGAEEGWPRYKYAVQVFIGEQRGEGVRCGGRVRLGFQDGPGGQLAEVERLSISGQVEENGGGDAMGGMGDRWVGTGKGGKTTGQDIYRYATFWHPIILASPSYPFPFSQAGVPGVLGSQDG